MRPFNLLPAPGAERRQDESQNSVKAIAIAAGLALVLVAVVVGVAFSQSRGAASDRQATLASLQAEVAKTKAAATVTAEVAAHTQAHLAAVTSASSGRMAWDGLLGQLSRVMPRGAWLDSLQTTTAAPTAPADSTDSTTSAVVTTNGLSSDSGTPSAGATLTVTGFATSQTVIPSVLERLALIPALSNVSLQTTQRADVAGKKATQFTINANVQSAGGIG